MEIVKCAYCNETGKEPHPDGKIHELFYPDRACSLCGGRGVLVVEHDNELIPCARCKSLGHEPHSNGSYYHQRKCKTCQGSGVLSLTGQLKIITDPSKT